MTDELDQELVDHFVWALQSEILDKAALSQKLAEHPQEAYAALDRFQLNISLLRQSIGQAAAKLATERAMEQRP